MSNTERPERLADGAPPRATAEVGEQRAVHVGRALGLQRRQPHDDPRRAEPALAGAGGAEGAGPGRPFVLSQALDGGDAPACDAARRRHARDPRGPVDQHRAAAALTLGAAAVLGRARAEAVAKDFQKRGVVVLDGDLATVEGELQRQLAEALPTAT